LKRLFGQRTHELKTWPINFKQIWNGMRSSERRKNDRAFQKGDIVIFK
jgi:predicted RNA-binding protein with PUA-like domain